MLKEELQQQITEAMKSGESLKVSTLRLLSNALHNEQIAKMRELTQEEEQAIVRRQIKQREEAIEAYSSAGRDDAADKESAELKILKTYLPEQMSEEELGKIVDGVIAETGKGNFGQVMGAVMAQVKGKADGKLVSRVVQEKLA